MSTRAAKLSVVHPNPLQTPARDSTYSCDLCWGTSFERLDGDESLSLNRCRGCGLVVCLPLPDQDLRLKIYAGPEYFMEPRNFALDFIAAVSREGVQVSLHSLREILRWMPPPARLLDIGCATGSKLLAAKQVGYQVAGVEISPYAAEFARKQGFNVFTGELEAAPFAEQSWDIILCHHVLEHLPRPSRLIRRCFQLLRPGGILVVEVPDFGSLPARSLLMSWPHFKPMEHIHYFERPSLARLLAAQGFRNLRFRRDGLLAVFEMWPFARRKQSLIEVRPPSPNPEKRLLVRAMGAFKRSLNRMPRVAQTMERIVFQLAPIHDFLRVYAVRE